MENPNFVSHRYDLTIRRYHGVCTAHCHHKGEDSDGKHFDIRTADEFLFWREIDAHILLAHERDVTVAGADPEKGIREMVRELSKAQQSGLEEQRAYNEALRSVFSRMSELCRTGYVVHPDTPGEWLDAKAIMEIMSAATRILNGPGEGAANNNGSGVGDGGTLYSNVCDNTSID